MKSIEPLDIYLQFMMTSWSYGYHTKTRICAVSLSHCQGILIAIGLLIFVAPDSGNVRALTVNNLGYLTNGRYTDYVLYSNIL